MYLRQEDYTKEYFDGNSTDNPHPAGYSQYVYNSQKWGAAAEEFLPYINAGDKVLEIGCAKGFLTAELRRRGVDVTGVDFSAYALAEADSDAVIIGANILTDEITGTYDLIISKDVLCVFTDADLEVLIPRLNALAPVQVHKIFKTPNPEYYNVKTKEQWEALAWNNATFI